MLKFLKTQDNVYFQCFIVRKKKKEKQNPKSKFRSLFPNLTKTFDPWTQEFMVWNKNQDSGISTLVHPDFYH